MFREGGRAVGYTSSRSVNVLPLLAKNGGKTRTFSHFCQQGPEEQGSENQAIYQTNVLCGSVRASSQQGVVPCCGEEDGGGDLHLAS